MKLIVSFSLTLLFACATIFVQAQNKNAVATAKFGVSGNCEMCKKTIESSVDVKGVKSAVWDAKTQSITIAYQPSKIEEAKLHELIAASGYDTELKKANESSFKALPECCQYTRKK